MMERRGKRPPPRGGRPRPFRSSRAEPEAAAPRPPADPRVCRICGAKVLDIRYHLEHVHPRTPASRAARLDPGAEDALREVTSLLEEARELVFKEPVRAMALVDRARAWVLWTRDRTKPRPGGPRPGVRPPATGKRLDMRAPAARPPSASAPPPSPAATDDEPA